MSRASLVEAYISGLNLTAVSVVCSGGQCRICADEPAPGEKVRASYHLKPTHADLVLMTIGREGLTAKQPAALAASIEKAAAVVGAPVMASDALHRLAAAQVEAITERVKTAGLSGALKPWNARYRQYRSRAGRKARAGDSVRCFSRASRHHADRARRRGERPDDLAPMRLFLKKLRSLFLLKLPLKY